MLLPRAEGIRPQPRWFAVVSAAVAVGFGAFTFIVLPLNFYGKLGRLQFANQPKACMLQCDDFWCSCGFSSKTGVPCTMATREFGNFVPTVGAA